MPEEAGHRQFISPLGPVPLFLAMFFEFVLGCRPDPGTPPVLCSLRPGIGAVAHDGIARGLPCADCSFGPFRPPLPWGKGIWIGRETLGRVDSSGSTGAPKKRISGTGSALFGSLAGHCRYPIKKGGKWPPFLVISAQHGACDASASGRQVSCCYPKVSPREALSPFLPSRVLGQVAVYGQLVGREGQEVVPIRIEAVGAIAQGGYEGV